MGGIERAHGDGGPDSSATVAKRAVDAPARRALANEAAVLGRVAHPGVVRLVAHTEADGHAQLLTEHVPGPTLAELTLDASGAVAGVGAAAAAVVADLHALGISHGSLAPEHLIVSGGRVVLCSFGRAGEATPAAIDRDVADLVVAMTAALHRLEEPTTRVERRHRRRLDELLVGAASRSLTAADLAAALAALASDAGESGVSSSTPGASVAADHLLFAEGASGSDDTGRSPLDPEPMRPAPEPTARPWRERVLRHDRLRADDATAAGWPRRRRVAIGAVAGLIVVAAWAAVPRDQPRTSDAALRDVPAAAPQVTPAPSPTPEPTTRAASITPEAGGVVVAGNVVGVDDAWFEVGHPGDVVRVGDWNCDGTVSPAVLRPTTGEVFVFDAWVSEGETLRVAPVAVRPDAIDLEARSDAECDTLLVVDRTGGETPIGAAS